MPSWDFSFSVPTGSATGILNVESEPPGAEAKASTGPSCRTPCPLSVPAAPEFLVTFSLAGFNSVTIPVRQRPPADVRESTGTVQFEPNPVYVQLEPLPPPPGKQKPKPKPKPKAPPPS
jgi:hypothetical protein